MAKHINQKPIAHRFQIFFPEKPFFSQPKTHFFWTESTTYFESEITKTGVGLSFPCNISINQIAAHYTSPPNDDTVFCNGDIVKIDLGAEVHGYISDTAVTVVVEGDNIDPVDENGNVLSMLGRLDDGNPIVTDEDLPF
jgi:methionyl aminopeptidase